MPRVLNSQFKEEIYGKSGVGSYFDWSLKSSNLGLVAKCKLRSKSGLEVALGYIY